jgi:hypothetical protein
LVATDQRGDKIRSYLSCLERATERSDVGYVVFSDSIVLTTKTSGVESLITVARACSRLMSDLLAEGIPLRGAISFGDFQRSFVAESVFVAGRAVIEAYEFEQAQKWVGVMLAPSTLRNVGDLELLCRVDVDSWLGPNRSTLSAFVQPCHWIPFDSGKYDGFAVVPTNGALDAHLLYQSTGDAVANLRRLRSLAPTPAAQKRYDEPLSWLTDIQQSWKALSENPVRQGSNIRK